MVAPCPDCAQATHAPRSPILERAYPRMAWPRPPVSGLATPTPWRRLAVRPRLWPSSLAPGCTNVGVGPRPRPLAARGRAVAWRARAGERTWSFHRPRPRMAVGRTRPRRYYVPCTRRSVTAMPVADQILYWASVSIMEGGRRYNQFLDPLI
jgi:hypothetical protein